MKKTNPRKRPMTEADFRRAKSHATDEAMKRMLEMFIYTLKDLGASDDALDKVMEKFKYTVDGINRGEITWSDVRQVLKSEYDISFSFT